MLTRRVLKRIVTYVVLALLTAAIYQITRRWCPAGWTIEHRISMALAWMSLLAIGATLAMGPFNILTGRANPASTNLRRDVGIWAGLTALAHVWYGWHVHFIGHLSYYFIEANAPSIAPRHDVFGLTNYLGALATIFILALLMTSNDLSLRRLGTQGWKSLHRLNYPIFALVAVHSWIFQDLEKRNLVLVAALSLFVTGVMVMQACGYGYRLAQRRLTSG